MSMSPGGQNQFVITIGLTLKAPLFTKGTQGTRQFNACRTKYSKTSNECLLKWVLLMLSAGCLRTSNEITFENLKKFLHRIGWKQGRVLNVSDLLGLFSWIMSRQLIWYEISLRSLILRCMRGGESGRSKKFEFRKVIWEKWLAQRHTKWADI